MVYLQILLCEKTKGHDLWANRSYESHKFAFNSHIQNKQKSDGRSLLPHYGRNMKDVIN